MFVMIVFLKSEPIRQGVEQRRNDVTCGLRTFLGFAFVAYVETMPLQRRYEAIKLKTFRETFITFQM